MTGGGNTLELVRLAKVLDRHLECGVRVSEELQPPHIPTSVAAAAIRAYRGHRISGERVIAMLRGQVNRH